jgi:hypothetical protein
MLKAVAPVWIGGVRTRLEVVMRPADGGRAVLGVVGVAACPGVALTSFELVGDEIDFRDLADAKTDRALVRLFGMPAVDVRELAADLATELVRDLVTDPPPAQPTPTTVH